MMSVGALGPYPHNARTHSKRQLRQIADSIKRFGTTNPVLISDAGEIIAGHGRVLAAKEAAALKGSAYVQKHIIERCQRVHKARRSEIETSTEIWAGYVHSEREAHAHALRNGLPMPTSLPHPDDVVIDPEHGVRFIGPWDAESEARLKQTLLIRDVLIMQDSLQHREDEPQPDHEGDTAMVVAMHLNVEWISRMMRL